MGQIAPADVGMFPSERGGPVAAPRVGAGKKQASRADWPSLPSSVVKSAGRALQILEYFDDTRVQANLADVSRALGYPESSASILLRSLVTMGYLGYDRYNRTYHPTSRVRLLGDWIEPKLFAGDAMIHLMERIHEQAAATVVLASRNGLSAQYIYVVQSQADPIPHLTRGVTRAITHSVPGFALLSAVDDIELGKIVRRVNADARDPADVRKLADVLGDVARVRNDGHILAASRYSPGVSVLAMPVPAGLSCTPLALAIGGRSEQMAARAPELAELMHRCMAEALQA